MAHRTKMLISFTLEKNKSKKMGKKQMKSQDYHMTKNETAESSFFILHRKISFITYLQKKKKRTEKSSKVSSFSNKQTNKQTKGSTNTHIWYFLFFLLLF